MKKHWRSIFLSFLLVFTISLNGFAKGNATVSIGKDLNSEQRQEILKTLGYEDGDTIIEVTNEEERQYLGSYVSPKLLGTRAISSSLVRPSKSGSGISVETKNISWVTEDMLISALVTAGVKDAYVKVAAPMPVSGTAALTGVIKGFEDSTGQYISEEQKQIASEEIATTGELGEDIGQTEAAQIMNKVKEEVIKNNLDDPEEIKKKVEEAAGEINISLTDEQKEQISELMAKVSNLDLNVEDIKSQLKNISDGLKKLNESSEEIKGFVAKILDFISQIADKFSSWLKK